MLIRACILRLSWNLSDNFHPLIVTPKTIIISIVFYSVGALFIHFFDVNLSSSHPTWRLHIYLNTSWHLVNVRHFGNSWAKSNQTLYQDNERKTHSVGWYVATYNIDEYQWSTRYIKWVVGIFHSPAHSRLNWQPSSKKQMDNKKTIRPFRDTSPSQPKKVTSHCSVVECEWKRV